MDGWEGVGWLEIGLVRGKGGHEIELAGAE